MVSLTFSVLCMYSKFGHHPHPLGYLCTKFSSFAASIAELAHGEKSCTHSLTHSIANPAYLLPQEPKHLRFGNAVQALAWQQCIPLSYQPPAVWQWLITCSVASFSVCLCVIMSCEVSQKLLDDLCKIYSRHSLHTTLETRDAPIRHWLITSWLIISA